MNEIDSLITNTINHLQLRVYDKKVQKSILFEQIPSEEISINELVVLAFAFNMALENYAKIRKIKDDRNSPDSIGDKDLSVILKKYFSAKFVRKLDYYEEDSDLNIENRVLQEFKQLEPTLFKVLQRFRNYFSHVVHEPGIVKLQDSFNGNTNLKEEDFDFFDAWLSKKFDEAKEHLVSSLETAKNKAEDQSRLAEIDKALNYFKLIKYRTGSNNLTYEAMLFFACMFLTRKQAKMILEKWPEFRVINGYENTIKTFFSYYCLSERYSINNDNLNLVRFRDITGKLTAIPLDPNPQMAIVYQKIREQNIPRFEKLNDLEEQVSVIKSEIKSKQRLIKDLRSSRKTDRASRELNIKKLQDEINTCDTEIKSLYIRSQQEVVPIKRQYVLTEALVRFILDSGLLKSGTTSWKVAVVKQDKDKVEYYGQNKEEINRDKNLVFLKNQIKEEKDTNRRARLREHLKELKRNFIFKDVEALEEEDKLLINRKNAMFQVSRANFEAITLTLPPDLLKKWVFIFLVKGMRETQSKLETYLSDYWNKVLKNENMTSYELIEQFGGKYEWIKSSKNANGVLAFPKSVYKAAGFAENKQFMLEDATLQKIKVKKEQIEALATQNDLQLKPWRFAAKQKIDLIMDYVHFSFLCETYASPLIKDTETFIRHTAFTIDDYNIAREYFRFFGRYEGRNIVEGTGAYNYSEVTAFKKKYSVYLSCIEDQISVSNSLETLYEGVSARWLSELEHPGDLTVLAKVFKVSEGESKEETNTALKVRNIKNLSVPDEFIQLKELCKEEWQNLLADGRKVSEFALIRRMLAGNTGFNTNADYIYKKVLPYCFSEGSSVPVVVNQKLLQMKTEELLMVAMAKHYWKAASGVELNMGSLQNNTDSSDYFSFTPYNKLYKTMVSYPVKINLDEEVTNERIEKYASIKRDPILDKIFRKEEIVIKVPTNRLDNKFLNAERVLIEEYIAWYEQDDIKKGERKFDYDEIELKIMRELGRSLSLIQLVLHAEKKLVSELEKNGGQLKKEMLNKYGKSPKIKDFYLEFKNKYIYGRLKEIILNDAKKQINKNAENKQEANKEIESLQKLLGNYLLLFRNFALHYKLQDPYLSEYIRKALVFYLKPKSTGSPARPVQRQKTSSRVNNGSNKKKQ